MKALSKNGIRRPLFAIAAIAALAIAAWGFWPRALEVEAGTVTRAPLTITFVEEGRTRLRDRHVVSAPLDGTIERVEPEPGDAVIAGDTLAMLRPSTAALLDPASRAMAQANAQAADKELAAAEASVSAAAAELERSRAALRRAEALARSQLIARAELDTQRAQATAAAATHDATRARRDAAIAIRDAARAVIALQGNARSDDARLPLRAPISGRIIQRHVESAGPIRAGQPVLVIGDLDGLEAIAEVLTADAVRISAGTPVRLLRWGGEPALKGHVRTIEPGGFTKVSALGVEEQRTVVVVAIDTPVAARAKLGDGYRVDAEFQVWQSADALTVPTAALFRDGHAWAVYTIENGRARLRRLELGQIGEDAAEVRAGLDAGSTVVLYPGDTVRDGMRVAGRAT